MIIYIGADHRGFNLKEALKQYLQDNGYTISDVGNRALDPNDDYPDFISAVAEKISADPDGAKGIVICGSGIGANMVANKFPRVRSALVMNADQAYLSRHDNNANVIAFAADFIDDHSAKVALATWLQTLFSGEPRHTRRNQKVRDIELKTKLL